MEFTTNAIADLELPAGKSGHFEWDDPMPSFGIRLRAGGKRSGSYSIAFMDGSDG